MQKYFGNKMTIFKIDSTDFKIVISQKLSDQLVLAKQIRNQRNRRNYEPPHARFRTEE